MKHTLELRDTEFVAARSADGIVERVWVDMVVETGVAADPFRCDVQLTLGEKVYEVAPMDLVVLGRAMEAYLEQRRAVEVVEHQIHPYMQYTR